MQMMRKKLQHSWDDAGVCLPLCDCLPSLDKLQVALSQLHPRSDVGGEIGSHGKPYWCQQVDAALALCVHFRPVFTRQSTPCLGFAKDKRPFRFMLNTWPYFVRKMNRNHRLLLSRSILGHGRLPRFSGLMMVFWCVRIFVVEFLCIKFLISSTLISTSMCGDVRFYCIASYIWTPTSAGSRLNGNWFLVAVNKSFCCLIRHSKWLTGYGKKKQRWELEDIWMRENGGRNPRMVN